MYVPLFFSEQLMIPGLYVIANPVIFLFGDLVLFRNHLRNLGLREIEFLQQ